MVYSNLWCKHSSLPPCVFYRYQEGVCVPSNICHILVHYRQGPCVSAAALALLAHTLLPIFWRPLLNKQVRVCLSLCVRAYIAQCRAYILCPKLKLSDGIETIESTNPKPSLCSACKMKSSISLHVYYILSLLLWHGCTRTCLCYCSLVICMYVCMYVCSV